jgi:four helix bundle protein
MFIAYEVSLELVQSLRSLVPAIEASDRDLGDQIKRAASSVVLDLAEGQRLTKGTKAKHYAIAHGSANEVKAALRTAIGWGWIEEADAALAILDRLLALLWRLTHPRSSRAACAAPTPT